MPYRGQNKKNMNDKFPKLIIEKEDRSKTQKEDIITMRKAVISAVIMMYGLSLELSNKAQTIFDKQ